MQDLVKMLSPALLLHMAARPKGTNQTCNHGGRQIEEQEEGWFIQDLVKMLSPVLLLHMAARLKGTNQLGTSSGRRKGKLMLREDEPLLGQEEQGPHRFR